MGERSRRARLAARIGLGLIGLGALAWLVAHSQPAEVLGALRGLPPSGLLVLGLFPLGIALDALAWTRLLARAGRPTPFVPAYLSRLAAEAVAASLPLGGVGAEALGPSLLSRRTGLPLTHTVSTSLAKRWVIARAHALYVLVGVGIAASFAPRTAAMRLDVALVTALAIAVASGVAQLSAAHGRPAGATLKALVKLPFLEPTLDGRAEAFSATEVFFAQSNAEVSQKRAALRVDQNVGRLKVAVDEAVGVGVVQRVCYPRQYRSDPVR